MIALVVVKIYAVTLSIGFSRRFSPKSGFWGIKEGLLTLGTCPPTVHWPTFQISGRSDENCGRYRGRNVLRTHTQTHTHTDIHSSDFISVQCHELHWTDNDDNNNRNSLVVVHVLANIPETVANIINVRPCLVIFNIPSGSCAFSLDMSICGCGFFHSGCSSSSNGSSSASYTSQNYK